jgi:hypothetical protein
MAISYPLALPTVGGIRAVEFRMVNAVAYSQSPFTFAGQAHAYQGQMWQADITVAPMNDDIEAGAWLGFLGALRGQFGTFLLGYPGRASLLGTATSCTVTGVAGDNTVSAVVPSGQTLLAGDFIQLGSGSGATLHKVLVNFTGTGSAADLEIWPALRTTRSAASATLSNAKGAFRLANNDSGWSEDIASYGITFAAREAI